VTRAATLIHAALVLTAGLPLRGSAVAGPALSTTWYEGDEYARARAEQEKTGAAMVLYVYTDWCPYCRAFEKSLLFTPDVERYLRDNVVKVRVNPETTAMAAALARRLGAQGYPSFFLRMPGRPPEKLALRVAGRLRTPAEFIAEIERRIRRARAG
jgi:thiol:disulfide interchange protein